MAERLVIAGRVKGEFANEVTIGADHADSSVGDEEGHALALVCSAKGDVIEAAEVAKGHATAGIHPVPPYPVLGGWQSRARSGLETCVEGSQRGLPVQGAMGSLLVVVEAEGVELQLEHRE